MKILLEYLKSFPDFLFDVAISELPVFSFDFNGKYLVTSTSIDNLSLGHQPDKLIEADVPIAVDIDHVDQVFQLLLAGRPTKGSHHLANAK